MTAGFIYGNLLKALNSLLKEKPSHSTFQHKPTEAQRGGKLLRSHS